jgi:hypothetical protein
MWRLEAPVKLKIKLRTTSCIKRSCLHLCCCSCHCTEWAEYAAIATAHNRTVCHTHRHTHIHTRTHTYIHLLAFRRARCVWTSWKPRGAPLGRCTACARPSWLFSVTLLQTALWTAMQVRVKCVYVCVFVYARVCVILLWLGDRMQAWDKSIACSWRKSYAPINWVEPLACVLVGTLADIRVERPLPIVPRLFYLPLLPRQPAACPHVCVCVCGKNHITLIWTRTRQYFLNVYVNLKRVGLAVCVWYKGIA